jgi:intermediate peptidase
LEIVTAPFEGSHIPSELFAAHQVSLQFLRDFEKSGIHLPDSKRRQFVELSDEAVVLGSRFLQPQQASSFTLTHKEAMEFGQNFVKKLTPASKSNSYQIEPGSHEAHFVARHHQSESVRRRAWSALNTYPKSQVELLEDMLRVRAKTARLLGKSSWAEIALVDKMAKSPGELSNDAYR